MKLPLIFVLAAASLSGCASGAAQLPTEDLRANHTHAFHIDAGTVRSVALLQDILPRTLASHGYLLAQRRRGGHAGAEFMTEWRASGPQERTRLVVETRPRGDRVAVTIYAVTYREQTDGRWVEAAAPSILRRQLGDIGMQLTFAAQAAAQP